MLFVKVDAELIKSMLETDGLDALIEEFKEVLPSVEEVILRERDIVLTYNLKKLCQVVIDKQQQPSDGRLSTRVAVYGMHK
eukprot:m.141107 g.141107  ORF g.141107 m.141107 type:complete len:81 (-) comp13191_c1_seq13:503-745(-)